MPKENKPQSDHAASSTVSANPKPNPSKHFVELRLNFVASCITGSSAVALFNPLDCLRVRWQTLPTAEVAQQSLARYGSQVMAREGLWRGLWAPGLLANALGIGCSTGLRLGVYPSVRDSLTAVSGAEAKTASSMFGAGLIAGSIGYWISTPLHLVKTRQQAEVALLDASGSQLVRGPRQGEAPLFARRTPGGVTAGLARIVQGEGFTTLWRGSLALATRGALISAGQFAGYDLTKTCAKQYNLLSEGPVLHTSAGVLSAVSAATLAAPADMLMTRFATAAAGLRAEGSYRSYVHCATELTRVEGMGVWMRGWWPMFVRMAPTFIIAMPLYEQLRRLLGLAYMD